MSKGAGIVGLFAGLAAIIGLALAGKSAHASPRGGGGEVIDKKKDVTVHAELQKMQDIVNPAVASKNPAKLRAAAAKLRSINWAYPESEHEAYVAANQLEAMAQDIEDYQKQAQYGQRQNTSEDQDYLDWLASQANV